MSILSRIFGNPKPEEFPIFRYHPDPISTGAIKESKEKCECCGKARGYVYTSTIYCPDEIEFVCPWCISDGSAAEKFDGLFSDDSPLAGLPQDIVDEVTLRTPGFNSWQQEVWMSCCNDACEFHGDIPKEEMKELTLEQIQKAFNDPKLSEEILLQIKKGYQPGGSPAIYKWKCKHCDEIQLYADFS